MSEKATRVKLSGTHVLDLSGVSDEVREAVLGLLAPEADGPGPRPEGLQPDCLTSGEVSDGFSTRTVTFPCHNPNLAGVRPYGEKEITYEHFSETTVCPNGKTTVRRWMRQVGSRITIACAMGPEPM